MPYYRKKPAVIEAYQFDGTKESGERIISWALKSCPSTLIKAEACIGYASSIELAIETLEGVMCASKDDYVIKGVKGEFYPCKPDIFKATYETV